MPLRCALLCCLTLAFGPIACLLAPDSTVAAATVVVPPAIPVTDPNGKGPSSDGNVPAQEPNQPSTVAPARVPQLRLRLNSTSVAGDGVQTVAVTASLTDGVGPLPGQRITWHSSSPNLLLWPTTALTDSNGCAVLSAGTVGDRSATLTAMAPALGQNVTTPTVQFTCQNLFAQPPALLTLSGGSLVAAQAADINRDGRADLLLSGAGQAMGLAAGWGNGRFVDASLIMPANISASAALVGDFTGDGWPDVVVSYASSPTLQTFINDGNGQLLGPVGTISLAALATSVQSGDFDGDGHLDLVASLSAAGQVVVAMGDGNGQFGLPTNVTVDPQPGQVAVGDINGDGRVDLAVACASITAANILNNGGVDFGVPIRIGSGGAGATGAALADLDADGRLDLAIVYATDSLQTHLGHGDGNFGAARPRSLAAGGTQLMAADLNGDGFADVVISGQDGLYTYLATSGGNLTDPNFIAVDTPNCTDCLPTVADLDNDGFADLMLPMVNQPILNVFINDGLGGFAPIPSLSSALDSPGNPTGVALVDLNQDGFVDMVQTQNNDGFVRLYLGNGAGTFTRSASLQENGSPFLPIVGNFDGDSNPDVVVCLQFTSHLRFYPGNGDGTTGTPVAIALNNVAIWMAAGDVDNDGLVDLVALVDTTAVVLQNTGDARKFAVAGSFAVGNNPQSLVLADLSGDGLLDVAVADATDNTVGVLLGTGGGNFAAMTTQPTPVGASTFALAAGDFDGDGHLDVVAGHQQDANLSYFYGDGTGALAPRVDVLLASPVGALLASDLNGDGQVDLAVALSASSNYNFFLGTPGSRLNLTPLVSPSNNATVAFAASDLNGDGAADLVAAQQNSYTFQLFFNANCL